MVGQCDQLFLFTSRTAYVGVKDTLSCDFEGLCYWDLESGVILTAEDAPSPLARVDYRDNPLGQFVTSQATQNETVIMSYTKAWYGCGYSFWYQLSTDGELKMRTTSGQVIWSDSNTGMEWRQVSMEGEQFFTTNQEDGVEFVLQGNGAVAGIV